MDIGTLALRGIIGPLFVGHGTQKLFGWFGGHGPDATGGFFEGLGLRPGRRHAIAAGTAEALGGILVTLGAFTPLAATMLTGTMVTAIRKVHMDNGPWVADNGYEYNAVLIGALAALVEHGPGRPSVDAALFPNWKGRGWAVAVLGAGIAGSFLVDALSQDEQAAAPGTPQAAATEEARFAREQAAQQQQQA